MPRKAFGFATAPPSSVVAGQSYTVSVTVTNQSKLGGVLAEYIFMVRFQLYIDGVSKGMSSYGIDISAGDTATQAYTFTVPTVGSTGYILASLATTDGTIRLAPVLEGDFTITQPQVIPGGAIAW